MLGLGCFMEIRWEAFPVQTGNDEMHEGLFPFPDGVECPLWVISGH